ncbi:hypothetical protein BpHYR1_029756 [Brachionus plicatilis]|uniref:Uncharacterized protein n=1 Tax=Brachionus plicatilis TaxID=10195 RepID=A0A3M7PFL0_BRAPC|nr:hypothetical protein BpHYR1_029756 [Brachionus plicatilis]
MINIAWWKLINIRISKFLYTRLNTNIYFHNKSKKDQIKQERSYFRRKCGFLTFCYKNVL